MHFPKLNNVCDDGYFIAISCQLIFFLYFLFWILLILIIFIAVRINNNVTKNRYIECCCDFSQDRCFAKIKILITYEDREAPGPKKNDNTCVVKKLLLLERTLCNKLCFTERERYLCKPFAIKIHSLGMHVFERETKKKEIFLNLAQKFVCRIILFNM